MMVPAKRASSEEDDVLCEQLPRQAAWSRIAGTGSHVPGGKLTNQDLERLGHMTDTEIHSLTGIRERRIAPEAEAASGLGYRAALHALGSARLSPEKIELIIVATVTPDTVMPSTACWLQGMLQCRRAIAFDINAACSGFIYALSVADQFIRAGSVRSALVVGVDLFSRIMNYEDRSTCILFGDGAGAVVLRATTGDQRILSTHLFADGAWADSIQVPAGGSREPASHQTVDQRRHTMVMKNGQQVFRVAVQSMSEAIMIALKENGLRIEDLDLLIPHQANIRIVEAVGQRVGLRTEHVFANLERYGNTSAASVPLALDEAVRGGTVKPGALVMLASFGAGATWGSALVRWG